VVAITLSGIVVAFAAMFIVMPVRQYQAQSRRAELVDSADAVLRLVGRDVRAALPNSVRVVDGGATVSLEVLNVVDAVRYRSSGATANASTQLDFSSPDTTFDVLSQFDGISRPYSPVGHYLAIYNVGVPGADAYSLSNVITPVGTTIAIDTSPAAPSEDRITIAPAFRFAYESPGRRVYLVSGPVKYVCDETLGTIRRYSGYAIPAAPSTTAPGGLSVVNALVASNVSDCQFDYIAGTSTRAGLVTLRVTLNKDGESIWLLHQVHVENAP
jgi:MSHA biogenesis protein MshO